MVREMIAQVEVALRESSKNMQKNTKSWEIPYARGGNKYGRSSSGIFTPQAWTRCGIRRPARAIVPDTVADVLWLVYYNGVINLLLASCGKIINTKFPHE